MIRRRRAEEPGRRNEEGTGRRAGQGLGVERPLCPRAAPFLSRLGFRGASAVPRL